MAKLMNGKRWIVVWMLIFFLSFVFMMVSSPVYFISNDVPLRFSNSISYDAKLNFIRNNQLLKDANTIVIGSSMALNNVNGVFIEKNSEKKLKVANISSWGLKTTEVLQLIKLIDLKRVKYIVYSTQYFDFDKNKLKDINKRDVVDFLNNDFSMKPYIKMLAGLSNNFEKYLNYKSIYLNENKYTNLNFDSTGSVIFDFPEKYIDKKRWGETQKGDYSLSDECYNALVELIAIAKLHKIKLIVVTTPFRRSVLNSNSNLFNIYNAYTSKLEKLSKKHPFIYLNTHETLNLTDKDFVDKSHLNRGGSILFSTKILESIINEL